jgi:hypothetical protein|tara:strand:- start:591 stop:899 length:309 start_codon:yes stop_codon:yes gene_type:complete
MEEEMRQGVMGANVQQAPASQPMELKISAREVSNNLQNLEEQEKMLITQLNVEPFRNFMSKVFGSQFGMVMKEAIPEPQVSQPSESPAPTQGQGMMTQPPSA